METMLLFENGRSLSYVVREWSKYENKLGDQMKNNYRYQ